MAFDIRKFERVWEVAGERPEELIGFFECETGLVPGKGPKAVFPHVAFIDPAGCRISTCVSHDLAAAIIRDWAVGWLALKAGVVIYRFDDNASPCNSVRLDCPDCNHGHPMEDEATSDDRTEALYLACCKVLDIDP